MPYRTKEKSSGTRRNSATEFAEGNQLEVREESHDILWEKEVGRLHSCRRSRATACSSVVVGVRARSAQLRSLLPELKLKREIMAVQREQIEFVISKLNASLTS